MDKEQGNKQKLFHSFREQFLSAAHRAKNTIFKLNEFIVSKTFYFVAGICIAIVMSAAISAVYAAWDTQVHPGDSITRTLWNDVVNKLTELDNRADLTDIIVLPTNGGTEAGCEHYTHPSCPGTHSNTVATWKWSRHGGAHGYCVRWSMCSK